MSNDFLLPYVSALRPDDARIAAEFDAASRTRVFDRIVAEHDAAKRLSTLRGAAVRRPRRPGWQRWVLAAVVAALTIAVLVVGTLVIGSKVPDTVAAANPNVPQQVSAGAVDLLHPGQYEYLIIQSRQDGGGAPEGTTVRSEWIDKGGTHLVMSTGPDGTSYDRGAPAGFLNSPTIAQLAAMPTDPRRLAQYLRANVSGSSSKDEAVYVAVGDILRTEMVPATLRGALVLVAASIPHTTVDRAADPHGRPAVRVMFIDNSIRPDEQQILYLDPQTLEITAEQTLASGLKYTSIVTHRTVIDSVPAAMSRCLPKAAPSTTAASRVPSQAPPNAEPNAIAASTVPSPPPGCATGPAHAPAAASTSPAPSSAAATSGG